jgi:hypothetical protein
MVRPDARGMAAPTRAQLPAGYVSLAELGRRPRTIAGGLVRSLGSSLNARFRIVASPEESEYYSRLDRELSLAEHRRA